MSSFFFLSSCLLVFLSFCVFLCFCLSLFLANCCWILYIARIREIEQALRDVESATGRGNLGMLNRFSQDKKPFVKVLEEKEKSFDQTQKESIKLKANINTAANASAVLTRRGVVQ